MDDIDKGQDIQVLDGDATAKAEADKIAAEAKAAEGKDGDGDADGKGNKSGDQGSKAESWHGQLDEEYRQDPSITKYKTPNDMAKGLKNLVGKLGADKIVAPKEDWGQEQWDEFYNAAGRPAAPDGYKITEVEAPEGMKQGIETEKFMEIVHKRGLSQEQADGLYQDMFEIQKDRYDEAMKANTEAMESAENVLRKEWGAAFEKNVKLSEKTFMALANDAAKAKAEKEGWGNDPDMIRLFADIGRERSEDNLGDGKAIDGVLTPDEAKAKMDAIKGAAMADPLHPYVNKQHPEHDALVAQMDDWAKMAYPEEDPSVIDD